MKDINNNTFWKAFLITYSVATLAMYLLFAFVLGVLNPFEWHMGARAFLTIISIVFFFVAFESTKEVFEEHKNNEQ